VRPHRSSRATHTHGEKFHCGPDARVSIAVMWPILSSSRGSRVAPSPMLCGKTVAPRRLPCPCTASTPYSSGIPSRVSSAARWNESTVSAQALGVFCAGTEPPPDSTLPRAYVVTRLGSAATSARSAWVIWPTFSASVIRPSRSATRCPVDSRGFSYGRRSAGGDDVGASASAVRGCSSEVATTEATRPARAPARRRRWARREGCVGIVCSLPEFRRPAAGPDAGRVRRGAPST
jgi:hypothetical protein